ncbi:protein IpaC [Pseudomonas gingeri]|uniref:Protein IpaC n=1 Tax=Pseudomonas gingeri TaxID=117681 RepID=A0A7Y7Y8R4_9PSED|nr:protein IpaC [Pseudomonas gingeri]NWB27414.1 protein IpaC [Pseudomonas gingeri]NWC31589.1 protein IpaC [Pseudomonas gingeri]NWD04199.1 protein IpaC [Pseudomonas gingeri]NWE34169.1 protein IpaC [Pseudomonas gingeri]NWE56579.1 protein IpaC [Pseudomonas gingeri]
MLDISRHATPLSTPSSLSELEAGQAVRQSLGPLSGEDLRRIVEEQVVVTWELRPPTPQALARLLDPSDFNEAEWIAVLGEAKQLLGDEDVRELAFRPSAWEKHTGVLIAAIIALNIARIATAELRGHFSVMTANAAVEQGKAIREGGNAALYGAIGGAAIAGSLALAGTAMTFEGYRQKQAGLATQKTQTLEALDLERDMRDNHLAHVAPGEPDVVMDIINDARQRRESASLDNQLSSVKWERLINLGGSVSGLAMVISNTVSSAVRLLEIAQKEREVLQQSNQGVQKSLGDEEAQIDASTAALLQKLLEIMQQINESRNRVIEATGGRV